jgi:HK97 gp10 family phage protein
MPMPKSVVKIRKDGVEYISNVDQAKYSIEELTRAALRDSAKFIRKRMVQELKNLPGMKRSKRIYSSSQYWVRRRETDLQIGFKHDSWYGARSELGTHGSPARNVLRNSVYNNIGEIRKIQAQYLSAIANAEGLINEDEYKSPEGDE